MGRYSLFYVAVAGAPPTDETYDPVFKEGVNPFVAVPMTETLLPFEARIVACKPSSDYDESGFSARKVLTLEVAPNTYRFVAGTKVYMGLKPYRVTQVEPKGFAENERVLLTLEAVS